MCVFCVVVFFSLLQLPKKKFLYCYRKEKLLDATRDYGTCYNNTHFYNSTIIYISIYVFVIIPNAINCKNNKIIPTERSLKLPNGKLANRSILGSWYKSVQTSRKNVIFTTIHKWQSQCKMPPKCVLFRRKNEIKFFFLKKTTQYHCSIATQLME